MDSGRASPPIFLFTDFGRYGPYVGQMKAAIHGIAPALAVIDLCHDVAPFQARPAAYLLAALLPQLPTGSCVVAVVDPGVGTARRGLLLEADGIRLIGPDNGLLAAAALRARQAAWRYLPEPPEAASATFHGRDWFAPLAARLQGGESLTLQAPSAEDRIDGMAWPTDWDHIVYIDRYGNAVTGLRAGEIGTDAVLVLGEETEAHHARTFGDVALGEAFWYINSCGLVEIAVNQGDAAREFGLAVGQGIRVRRRPGAVPGAT